jgi:hypothetical protein
MEIFFKAKSTALHHRKFSISELSGHEKPRSNASNGSAPTSSRKSKILMLVNGIIPSLNLPNY